jgi:hypothetical protein
MKILSTRGICTSGIETLIHVTVLKPGYIKINFCGKEKIINAESTFSLTESLRTLIPNNIMDGTPNEDGPLLVAMDDGIICHIWIEHRPSGKPLPMNAVSYCMEGSPLEIDVPAYGGRLTKSAWPGYPSGQTNDTW